MAELFEIQDGRVFKYIPKILQFLSILLTYKFRKFGSSIIRKDLSPNWSG